MQDSQFDVAIVGASVSGASLAIRLGRKGISTALIDRAKFPRRKACGEGVSDIALDSLNGIGLSDDIKKLQGLPFCSYRLDFGDKSVEFASGKSRYLKGIGLQRYLLDKMLVDRAAAFPSIRDFLEIGVKGIKREGNQFVLDFSTEQNITAKYLVLADGANSGNSKRLGISRIKGKRPLWGISYTLEGSYSKFTKEVLILLKNGFEVYCTPVSDTMLNVAFLTRKETARYLKDHALQDDLLVEAKEKCFFQGEAAGPPLSVGPVGATKRPYRSGSILLIGDAAESLDPISGMGITHGVLNAELAAKALISIIKKNTPVDKALDEYANDCERMSRPYRGFTRLTGGLLRSPLRSILIPALVKTNLPYLIRSALKYPSYNRTFPVSLFTIFLRLVGK